MKRDDRGFIRPAAEDIDPAVQATLSHGQQRQADAHLTKRERSKKQRQAEKNAAAAPRRVDWLIDPALKAWITEQASGVGCTSSSVVEFAVHYLQSAVEAGEVDLSQYTDPIQNTRYRVRLNYPITPKLG